MNMHLSFRKLTSFSLTLFLSLMSLKNVPCSASLLPTKGVVKEDLKSLADIIEPLLPAVVNISTITELKNSRDLPSGPNVPPGSFEDLFRKFFEEHMRPRKTTSLGSGFIINQQDETAFVVTCDHVIGSADEIKVILHDKTELKAEIVGRDRRTDLALLKVKTKKKLSTLEWGDSSKARVGDTVIAIGNPFGLGGSATRGIVSAIARDIAARSNALGQADYVDGYLQTDASINMGNSGGPMFNADGTVWGINTAIFSPTGGSIGIGFAIPSNLAKLVIVQLKEHGRTIRGWLGVQIQPVTEDSVEALGLKSPEGALVGEISSQNSPAGKAGLKEGDVILSFNGQLVKESRQLPRMVGETPIGKKVPMTIWRNGHELTLTVTPGEFEKAEKEGLILTTPEQAKGKKEKEKNLVLGMSLKPLTPNLAAKLGLKEKAKGLFIEEVIPYGPADKKGLQRGDIILKVITKSRQEAIQSPEEFKKLVQNLRKNNSKAVLVLVQREGTKSFTTLSFEDEEPAKESDKKKSE